MKEIKKGLDRFDLMGFIGMIFDFMRLNDISSKTVVCFSEDGNPLELEGEEISRDYIHRLLFQGKTLFLPFSDINVGEPIPCADGGRYLISDPDGLDEEVAVSANEVESVGFLVRVERPMIIICPAVLRGGEYEAIELTELEEDLKEFSEPINKFVRSFEKN